MPLKISNDVIKAAMTSNNAWTKKTLAEWGVPWPPPQGWRNALINGTEIPKWCGISKHEKEKLKAKQDKQFLTPENTEKLPISNKVLTFPEIKGKQTDQQAINTFYTSWEWRQLRYVFIKTKNRRCSCCGTTPDHGIRIVVDHIKPIRYFWHLRLEYKNLQLLCDECNMGKGSWDQTNWKDTT